MCRGPRAGWLCNDSSLHLGASLATAAWCSLLSWLWFFGWAWEAMPAIFICVWLAQKNICLGSKKMELWDCARSVLISASLLWMPSVLWIWGSKATLLWEKVEDILA